MLAFNGTNGGHNMHFLANYTIKGRKWEIYDQNIIEADVIEDAYEKASMYAVELTNKPFISSTKFEVYPASTIRKIEYVVRELAESELPTCIKTTEEYE